MRCMRRHLPYGLHHLHRQRPGARAADEAQRLCPQPGPGSLHLGPGEDRPHHGQGRGCLPALRLVRRALPHGCLGHAEVPPPHRTGGERMPEPLTATNDFVVKFANVNGSGSASANRLFARSILRMGVPVSSRNIFPSNIQGLPTWYEVRVSEAGWRGRRGGVDLMVAMNPQTWDRDVAEIAPGGYLLYDCTRPVLPSKLRGDVIPVGVPLTEICDHAFPEPRQRQLFKNIVYVGVLAALLGIELAEIEKLI